MLSKKTKYALKAVLVLARNYGVGPMLIAHISETENIPKKFLENILLELKNAGIIDASPTSSPYSFAIVDDLDTLYPNATGTIKVVDYTDGGDITEKQVTVTVTWSGSSMRQGNGSITTTSYIEKQ